jgi:hypothetical protein
VYEERTNKRMPLTDSDCDCAGSGVVMQSYFDLDLYLGQSDSTRSLFIQPSGPQPRSARPCITLNNGLGLGHVDYAVALLIRGDIVVVVDPLS